MPVPDTRNKSNGMSWISPTFSDDVGPSTPAPKRRRAIDISEAGTSINPSTSKSTSNWLKKYCPKNVDDLAVNIKKLNELETWLKQTSISKLTSKFLLLTGPSGCGKTTSLQVLCRKLGFCVKEWITPLDKTVDYSDTFSRFQFPISASKQFEEYLFRSSRYGSCLSSNITRTLVLVKDFPNAFIHNPSTFHESLERLADKCVNPVVFICSDESLCRKLFPVPIKTSYNIHHISFNPIPDQRVIKVLKGLLQQESKHNKSITMLPDESFYTISSSCQGDLRSAITKLYFYTIHSKLDVVQSKSQTGSKKAKSAKESVLPDKDKRIDFFHGVGRVLYPKKIESEKGLNFVHSTSEIVETFLCEPNNFINQLHENYPSKLGNVYDLSMAAERMSKSDILMSRWQEKDIFYTYSLSVAVQGLMVSNKDPQKAKFESFKRSQTSRLVVDSKSIELEGKSVFSDLRILDYESLLDVLPFSRHLLPNLNQGQIEFARKVCTFK